VIALDEEPYFGTVYDFTVKHPSHNFIADGFLVSNCGVRLLRTELEKEDVLDKVPGLVSLLFKDIPTGVGSHRRDFKLSPDDEKQVLKKGARWVVERGHGSSEDLAHIEDGGTIHGADISAISNRALERGRDQLGTLGAGNHFVEVGFVAEIFDQDAAARLGLFKDQIVVTIHTGSRGLGYQICDDSLDMMIQAAQKYHIELPDRQLCCAPITSPEGERYLASMAAAANYALANRQMITYYIREAFEHYFRKSAAEMDIETVYDISHNMAKFEEHMIGGASRRLLVHRKGATRAFPGQPVLIPGDMGRYSFVLIGAEGSMKKTFGSTCHGAGRLMSRNEAKRQARGRNIIHELGAKGITVFGASKGTVVEEMPDAYKDVAEVVDVVAEAGLSKKVAKIVPLGVIKG
jgi:tRNA-splicing ligase RtcB